MSYGGTLVFRSRRRMSYSSLLALCVLFFVRVNLPFDVFPSSYRCVSRWLIFNLCFCFSQCELQALTTPHPRSLSLFLYPRSRTKSALRQNKQAFFCCGGVCLIDVPSLPKALSVVSLSLFLSLFLSSSRLLTDHAFVCSLSCAVFSLPFSFFSFSLFFFFLCCRFL